MRLRKLERKNLIHGVQICRGAPKVSQLFFADDCLLFFRANLLKVESVKLVLNGYEKMAGQAVNFHKSVALITPNVKNE